MRVRALAWLAAVALIVGGAILAVDGYGDGDAADTVRAYFAALARGDASTALAFGAVPSGDRRFLTGDVLQLQEKLGALRDVHVDDTDQGGSAVSVHVSFTVALADGDHEVDTTVEVARRGSEWRLVRVAAPVTLRVAAAQNLATLAGAQLPDGPVLLFPGAVPVQFATPYLTASSESGAIGPDASGEVRVTPVVAPAGEKALRAALARGLHDCYPAGGPSRVGCPLPAGDRIVPDSLSGRLADNAVARVHFAVAGVGDGRIRLTGSLPFTGRYEQLDFVNLPHARRGAIRLALAASAAPVPPARILLSDSG